MRKELVIPGVIVAACLGLVVLTLTLPKKSKSVSSDTPQSTDNSTSFGSDTVAPTEGFGTAPTAPVGFGSPTTPTGTTGFGSTTTTPSGFGTPAPAAPSFTTPSTSTAPVGFGKPAPVAPAPTPTFGQNPAPVAPIASTPTVSSGEKTHVVAKGETLGDISMKYYGSSKHWKKIAEANKIDPASLQVGQKLTLPEIAAPTPAASSDAAASDERTYKIKAGDTYYTIAKKELGSAARWKEIEKLNKLSPEDLRVGMSIKLPAAPLKKEGATKDTTSAGDNASTGRTHTVAAGETLGDISRKHYGTSKHWKKIVEANPGVDAESLKVGQKLNLPEIAGAPAASTTSGDQSTAPASIGAEYVVKAGDTMEIIAQNQLGKKSEAKRILEANPGVDPRRLRIGQKLIIPGKTASEPAPAVTPVPNTMPAPMDNFGTPPPTNTGTPAPLQPLPPSTGGFSSPADNPFAQPGLNNGSNPP